MTEEKEIEIKTTVYLSGSIKDKFEAIKEKLGMKNNTEVFRYLITKQHAEICGS